MQPLKHHTTRPGCRLVVTPPPINSWRRPAPLRCSIPLRATGDDAPEEPPFDAAAFALEWESRRNKRAEARGFTSATERPRPPQAPTSPSELSSTEGVAPMEIDSGGDVAEQLPAGPEEVEAGLQQLAAFMDESGQVDLEAFLAGGADDEDDGEMDTDEEVQAMFQDFLRGREGGAGLYEGAGEDVEGEADTWEDGEIFRSAADDDGSVGSSPGSAISGVDMENEEDGPTANYEIGVSYGVDVDGNLIGDWGSDSEDEDDEDGGGALSGESGDSPTEEGAGGAAAKIASVPTSDVAAWTIDDEPETAAGVDSFGLGAGWGVAAGGLDAVREEDEELSPSDLSSPGMRDVLTNRGDLDSDTSSMKDSFLQVGALASLPAHALRALEAEQLEADRVNGEWVEEQRRRQREGRPGKLQKKLRIITGSAAGKRLVSPSTTGTRPMMEKVRGAVMSMLLHLCGAGHTGTFPPTSRWLDLFAGTGAVGLEALSRGVGEAHFVESDAWTATACTAANAEACGLAGASVVHTMRAEDFLRKAARAPRFAGGAFDFVSVCPPYLLVSYPELFELLDASPLLHEGSVVFIEYPRQLRAQIADRIGPLSRVKDRKYGRTLMAVYAGSELEEV